VIGNWFLYCHQHHSILQMKLFYVVIFIFFRDHFQGQNIVSRFIYQLQNRLKTARLGTESLHFISSPERRVIWGIVITVRPSSPLNFYILIFISETTGPIRTKLSRNVDWMVLYKKNFPNLKSTTGKKEVQRGQIECFQICYGYE